jgi:hypothetical protein
MSRPPCIFIVVACCIQSTILRAQLVKSDASGVYALTQEGASYFAKISLQCAETKYPHTIDVRNSYKENDPRKIWPSFYGCYDWHSSVHNHWCLVKLLKLYPNLPERDEIVERLDFAFNKDHILVEAQRVASMENGNFEFPYGQSWFLKLAEELNGLDHPKAKIWLKNCRPLLKVIEEKHLNYWPTVNEVRFSGSHDSPAMGISFALDYARTFGRKNLEMVLISAARRFYADKNNVPLDAEPLGWDFMSGYLLVADLMRKVYNEKEFNAWLLAYAPDLMDLSKAQDALIIKREKVHTGMKSHWDGFHLNRIWCLNGLMMDLPNLDPSLKAAWVSQMNAMWDYAQESIGKGNYDVDHWLSSFSVFALHGYR